MKLMGKSLLVSIAGSIGIALIAGTVMLFQTDKPLIANICRMIFSFFFAVAGILIAYLGLKIKNGPIIALSILLIFVSAKQLFSGMRK